MHVKIYKITERNNKLVTVLSSGVRRKGIGLSVNVIECFNFICNILLLLCKGKKEKTKISFYQLWVVGTFHITL